MIDFILRGHKFFYGMNEKNHYKGKDVVLWLLTNLAVRFLERSLNIWLECRRVIGIVSKPYGVVNENVVLSFTSYPARIDSVWKVVDSIMRQTMLPRRIQLWLSLKNFPNKECDLPRNLKKYIPYGLEICWTEDDLRPHKKYLYAFQKFEDMCVITIDDDIYYRRDLIDRLWSMHERFPNAVCGNRGKKIIIGESYQKWSSDCSVNQPSHYYLLTGCGGVIYPVYLFDKVNVDQLELIKRTSLYTDDLWLKAMELLNEIPVVVGDYYPNGPIINGSQKESLMLANCDEKKSRNDESWKCLDEILGLDEKIKKYDEKILGC